MAANKKVIIIGIDPFLIDFSTPEFAAFPGMTAEKVMSGTNAAIASLATMGYEAEWCPTDFGETAGDVVKEKLQNTNYAAVLIGAGARVPPSKFLLFESLLNVVHEYAPTAKICFNTSPMDTAAAIQRWV